MPRLMMVGLSHRAVPLEIRERVAIDESRWRAVAPAEPATILLSTCNRVEVYAWIDGRTDHAARAITRALAQASVMSVSELEASLTVRAGREALTHLVRVASGLDSLVVGEEQIRGQVRQALAQAEASTRLPASLRGVFQRVTESARRVRGSTQIGRVPSIAAAGINVARRQLHANLSGELAVVLGAGVMARASAEALLAAGARVRVLNRTPEHAERLLGSMHGSIEIGSLEELPSALSESALVVGATASRIPVLTRETVSSAMSRRGSRLLILDIALPRDVEPEARDVEGVTLIDLDDLERLCPVDVSIRRAEHQKAEALALAEADRLSNWLRTRAASPAIAELRDYAEGIRANELRRSAARLRELTPEQMAAVDALTASIVNKLMHGPTVALRGGRSRSHILRVVRPNRRRTA